MIKKNYFFNPLKSAFAIAIVIGLTALIMSYSSSPPSGRTGAPDETSCLACHNTSNTGFAGFIELQGLPSDITANETYPLTIRTISTQTRPVRGGFSLVVLDANNENSGSISTVGYDNLSFASENSRDYVSHSGAQLFGGSDTISWSFDWTAPNSESSVSFYAASVLANGINGTDGDTAIIHSESHQVSAPLELEVTIDNVTEPLCFGYTNGVAHATVTNGIQPFTYQWSTGDTLAWIYSFAAGTYGVTVTDAQNNIATQVLTLGQPTEIIAEITASANSIPCGESVELTITSAGGTGSHSYTWNTGAGNVDSIFVNQGGYYCAQIFDENQCAVNKCIAINGDPNGVFCNGISTDTITCNYPTRTLFPGVTSNDTITYSWTGPNSFTSTDTFPQVTEGGTYTLVASISSGCSCTSTIEVIEHTTLELSLMETNPTSCAYTADGNIEVDLISGGFPPFSVMPEINGDSLAAGDYAVTVTNGVGCTTVLEFTIESPDSILVTLDSITPIEGSTPGAIAITTIGGTPNYGWAWISGVDTITFANIPNGSLNNITTPGDFILYVFDSNDCLYSYGPYSVPLIEIVQDVAFANSLTIAPNPALDYFSITQKDPKATPVDVLIYGINNQLIKSLHFSERSPIIDVGSLPNGLYQVVIQSGQRLAIKQLIVKR